DRALRARERAVRACGEATQVVHAHDLEVGGDLAERPADAGVLHGPDADLVDQLRVHACELGRVPDVDRPTLVADRLLRDGPTVAELTEEVLLGDEDIVEEDLAELLVTVAHD